MKDMRRAYRINTRNARNICILGVSRKNPLFQKVGAYVTIRFDHDFRSLF
jgi:hypothetical protein